MISLIKNTVKTTAEPELIVTWSVWFQTPFGIAETLKEAVERCIESDLDPEIFVTPIPIAISESGRYEIFFPRR